MTDEAKSDLPDDLKQFESLLRGCTTPSTPRLERDRLMWLAGRASAEAEAANSESLSDSKPSPLVREGRVRGSAATAAIVAPMFRSPSRRTISANWAWPLTTAALLLLSLTLASTILFRRAETRIVYVTEPAPSVTAVAALPVEVTNQPTTTAAEPNYLHVRNLVLAHGVEALPDAHTSAATSRYDGTQVTPLLRQDF